MLLLLSIVTSGWVLLANWMGCQWFIDLMYWAKFSHDRQMFDPVTFHMSFETACPFPHNVSADILQNSSLTNLKAFQVYGKVVVKRKNVDLIRLKTQINWLLPSSYCPVFRQRINLPGAALNKMEGFAFEESS